MGTLTQLIEQGFDLSEADAEDKTISVRCSGCSALVINTVPCHETGCPNKVVTVDCFNCGYPVPRGECCDCTDPLPDDEGEDDE